MGAGGGGAGRGVRGRIANAALCAPGRPGRWAALLAVGALWWWAVARLALWPQSAGVVEGAVAAGGWGLSLLPVHCVPWSAPGPTIRGPGAPLRSGVPTGWGGVRGLVRGGRTALGRARRAVRERRAGRVRGGWGPGAD